MASTMTVTVRRMAQTRVRKAGVDMLTTQRLIAVVGLENQAHVLPIHEIAAAGKC